jgi:hypothetical protein
MINEQNIKIALLNNQKQVHEIVWEVTLGFWSFLSMEGNSTPIPTIFIV